MMGQSNATACTVQSERTASNGRLPKEGIMKITAVECAVLMAPDFDPDHCDTAQDNVVVQVHTDDTVRGIGEVESNPWAIKALIEYGGSNSLSRGLAELLVGQDPSDPRAVWEWLYSRSIVTGRRGAGVCAIGALDMAIWDICGKAGGSPVWKLLGHARTSPLTPYASLLPYGHTLRDYRESLLTKAAWARDAGFKAAKMEIMIRGPFAEFGLQESNEAIVELVAASREVIGSTMTMMVDVGYCWSDWKEALQVLRRLEKYDLFFLETPLQPDDLDGYARLADASEVRIAAGELLQTRFEFAELIDRGRVDVVQPDVGRVGGITEALRVVEMARDRGKLVVPHCWKSGIGIAATAHVAAVSPNCPFIEFLPAAVSESSLRRELVADELCLVDGKLELPERPGLGITLNEAALAKFSVG
jgi:L-rhamnonate dehydratase